LKQHPWLSTLSAIATALVVYYAFVAVFGPHLAEVYTPGKDGRPGKREEWDIVTAVFLRLFNLLDEHNGVVAALAGVVVAIFTGVLWNATEKLWGASERQRLDARHSIYAGQVAARAALRNTRAAERMARAADYQYQFAGKQVDIAEAQKTIERLQYYAQHRPKFVLKEVFMTEPGQWNELTYELVNSGGSEGFTTGGFVGIGFVSDFREFRIQGPQAISIATNVMIPPGGSFLTLHYIPGTLAQSMRVAFEKRSEMKAPLYFFGRIFYIDGRREAGGGIVRQAVFRRCWRAADNSFHRTGDDDHEYSD
jgi:hypothetical protein